MSSLLGGTLPWVFLVSITRDRHTGAGGTGVVLSSEECKDVSSTTDRVSGIAIQNYYYIIGGTLVSGLEPGRPCAKKYIFDQLGICITIPWPQAVPISVKTANKSGTMGHSFLDTPGRFATRTSHASSCRYSEKTNIVVPFFSPGGAPVEP